MARLEKTRVDTEMAKVLLGPQWKVFESGRPYAMVETIKGSIVSFKRDLYRWPEMSEDATILRENGIELELLWPYELEIKIDLADFYRGENGQIQHPLKGYQIPELVKATGYPFNFPDRVRAIPAVYLENDRLKIGVDQPNRIIFIEPWSHYDDYNTAKYDSPEEAFAPRYSNDCAESFQFSEEDLKIGCNIYIMPMGYDYKCDIRMERSEALDMFLQKAEKWSEILRKFFAGEDDIDEDKADEISSSPMEDGTGKDETDSLDSSPEEDVMDVTFDSWRHRLHDGWREKFLTPKNVSILRQCEVFAKETENGLQLYTVADPRSTSRGADDSYYEEYEQFDGVWYHIQKFIYCEAHFLPFTERLNELQSTHRQLVN